MATNYFSYFMMESFSIQHSVQNVAIEEQGNSP